MRALSLRFTRLFAAFLIVCLIVPGKVTPVYAAVDTGISFVGGTVVHLAITGWDSGETLVLDVTASGFSTSFTIPNGTASWRVTGLPANELIIFTNRGTGQQLNSIMSGTLGGTMLYDESLEGLTLTPAQALPPLSEGHVLVSNSHSLTLQNCTVNGDMSIETRDNSSVHVNKTTFTGRTAFSNTGSSTNRQIKVESSVFQVGSGNVIPFVNLYGGIEFINNEVSAGAWLSSKSNVLFDGNIFEGPIIFDYYDDWSVGPYPTIQNNSFLGDEGLKVYDNSNFPVTHLGSNYYGDPNLYVVDETQWGLPQHRTFLKIRGARNYRDGKIVLDGVLSDGNTVKKLKPSYNSVHLISYIIGQNTLNHDSSSWSAMMERKTLLSIDLGTSFETLSNVKIIVHFNGKDYTKTVTLHHKINNCTKYNSGKCTVDFELDPVPFDGLASEPKKISVDVDLSGVEGSVTTTPYQLFDDTIYFFSPPKRPLKIRVIPITFGGLCSGKADASAVYGYLRDYLPAFYPLRRKDIDVQVRPPHTYDCYSPIVALTQTSLATAVIAETAAMDKLFENDKADLVVAVVPCNMFKSLIFNPTEGMTLRNMNSVILVSDAFPAAFFHEMGHWAGLAISPEQYDQYPPNGLPLRNATVYDPDGRNVKEMTGQIEHFIEPHMYGQTEDRVFDIMSNINTIWPLYDTTQKMRAAIYKTTGYSGASAQDETQVTAAPPADTPGKRTLYFFGKTFNSHGLFYLSPGELHMMNLTGTGLNPGDSPEVSQYNQELFRYTYDLNGYDQDGNLAYTAPFVTYMNDDYGELVNWVENGYIFHTYQVPESVVRIVVSHTPMYGGDIILDQALGGSVESHFTTPAAGIALGTGDVTLRWTNPSSGLLHLLAYSADNGATWHSLDKSPAKGDSMVIPAGFLPTGSQIIFRMITSNGFESYEDRVGGLSVTNRPPQVTINNPPDGAVVEPGMALTLNASVDDFEDGTPASMTWTSSLDGALGTGNYQENVVLSTGTHTLTFTAADSQEAAASQQVKVTVGTVSQVDLKLDTDAVSITCPEIEAGDIPHSLDAGVACTLKVNIRGVGVDSTPSISLYYTPKGGTEKIIKTEAVSLPAFGQEALTASFTPAAAGEYTFRAVINSSTPADSNAANNQAELKIEGNPPVYSITGNVLAKKYYNSLHWVTITDEYGQTATSGDYGSFTLPNMLPGTHTLTATANDILFDPVTVEVKDANVTGVQVFGTPQKFSIIGNGPAVSGVFVTDETGRRITTDVHGWFKMRGFSPGDHTLTFTKKGYKFSPESVTITITDTDMPIQQNFAVYSSGGPHYLPLMVGR